MTNKNYQSNLPRVKYVLDENEKSALKAAGKFVRDEARKNLDTVVTLRTGFLKKNIGYSIKKKTKSVSIGTKRKAFYGLFIEKGHKIRPQKKYRLAKAIKNITSFEFGSKTVAARPFLGPAFLNNINRIRQVMYENLHNIKLDKVPPPTITDKVIE